MRLGTEVLRCRPFAHVVSKDFHTSVCDSCCRPATKDHKLKKCTVCKYVFYCDKQCQKESWNIHRFECKYLYSISPKVPTDTVRLMARIIVKLRLGGSKEIAELPNGNRRSFFDLMAHTKDVLHHKCRMDAFNAFFDVLCVIFKDTIPPKSEVLDIFCRIVINSFNIMNEDNQSIGVGLYLAASAFDHSCEPNAAITFDGSTLVCRVIDEVPDNKFSNLRISYIDTSLTTARRQSELKTQYYFDCKCIACDEDPAGLEPLKRGSFKCPACRTAIAISAEDNEGEFVCFRCSFQIPSQLIKRYWTLLDEAKLALPQYPDAISPKLQEQCLELCSKMKDIFHPFDRSYAAVLEECYERYVKEQSWREALEVARELMIAYKQLYPRYDVNTALLLLKMAKIAHLLSWSVDAEEYLHKAKDIIEITHGKEHSLYKNVLTPLDTEVKLELEAKMQKESEADLDRSFFNPTYAG